MNLVDMPQVTVFLVTYVNFFDKCKLFKPKKSSLSGENCQSYRYPSILQKLYADKCQGSEFFGFYNTYKPKLCFLATKILDW